MLTNRYERNEKIKKTITKLKAEEILDAAYIDEPRIIYIEIPGPPESYSRERKGRGSHFYNPKSNEMETFRLACLKEMKREDYDFTRELIKENSDYRIKLSAKFYLPIPLSDSLKTSALKHLTIIKPTGRPDLDNYLKFLLDSLHEVFYDDDSKVYSITGEKLYSMEPRTEIFATIEKTTENT